MSTIQILLSMAVCLFIGLMLTRLFKPFHLPDVTAYLIGGVLIGTYCLGRFTLGGFSFGFNQSVAPVEAFTIISDIALGFIAFDIGNEFRVKDLKKIGKQASVIGIIQALVATIVVDAALIGLHFILLSATGTDYLPLPACILLGAIASATAPAATLMVVRQYKAKGKLTDLLLPIVALDDAVGLIIFAVSFGISKAMYGGHMDVISVAVEPLLEILLSLALGAVLGVLLSYVEKLFHSHSNRLTLMITFVLLSVALAKLHFTPGYVNLHFSSLLTCMMMGTVFCNLCSTSEEMMERTEKWTKPIFLLFFVISGASLDLSVFAQPLFVLIGVIYILFRSLGKYFGAMGSAKMVHCDKSTVKYLGITLLPQAGVALGMVSTVAADSVFGHTAIGNTVRFTVLFGVLVYEIFGPMMTKWALTRAGDITAKPEGITARRENPKE
ncbi:MAG: sodium:proton antiporter [Ruminococcaceae bacterium]|nr:sodium:proton antiporter [Oscillospiraceae bacterium]